MSIRFDPISLRSIVSMKGITATIIQKLAHDIENNEDVIVNEVTRMQENNGSVDSIHNFDSVIIGFSLILLTKFLSLLPLDGSDGIGNLLIDRGIQESDTKLSKIKLYNSSKKMTTFIIVICTIILTKNVQNAI